jgi:NRAMP (natural resistance-associated macrophage protein)-like metal ion transporter
MKSFLQKAVEAPAAALGRTISASRRMTYGLRSKSTVKQAGKYWKTLGPGLITGAADDDPSGIATYSQTGAKYGFQLLWLAAFTFPLMGIVQEMCARIGLETGRGLAGNIRRHFPKWVVYPCVLLLIIANTFNIGADLGAMAKSTQLLAPGLPFGLLIAGYTALILGLLIFTTYKVYAFYLKWLAMILFSYVFSAFLAHPHWGEVLHSLLSPSLTFSRDQLLLVCGILGTTISPYLFFWQTSQEIEEEIQRGKKSIASRSGATKDEVRNMRVDVWSGMFFSNLVMFFIITVCAATLFRNGVHDIQTAEQAAAALVPFAGKSAELLFAVGIIGTGLLAIPVLAGSSSYALAEVFGWRFGLDLKLNKALAFYGVIILSLVLGYALNFVGIDPIKALIWSAILNGLVAPVIIALIVSISSNRKIMGKNRNRTLTTWIGWMTAAMMAVVGVAGIIALL